MNLVLVVRHKKQIWRMELDSITDEDIDLNMMELDIKIEESEVTKEQNPEVMTIPPTKPDLEVSVQCLFITQQCFIVTRPFTATKREIIKIHFNYPYVCMYRAISIVYYPDQPLHNMYINNKFLYHNFTSIVTFPIKK
jgi:hypothetical protein